jgi:hypothetical protein
MVHLIILQKLSDRKITIEFFLSALAVAGIAFKFSGVRGGDEIMMITLNTLAIFYFVSAYFPPLTDHFFGLIATRVLGIASAVCVIGFLFSWLQMPGATEMLLIGVSSFIPGGLILLYFWLTTRDVKFVPLLIRIFVLGSLGVFMLRDSLDEIFGQFVR